MAKVRTIIIIPKTSHENQDTVGSISLAIDRVERTVIGIIIRKQPVPGNVE